MGSVAITDLSWSTLSEAIQKIRSSLELNIICRPEHKEQFEDLVQEMGVEHLVTIKDSEYVPEGKAFVFKPQEYVYTEPLKIRGHLHTNSKRKQV